ncbi:hypothetical protein A6A03_11475 [Chloroflexus islandicus]|uniref:Uncharacterized protein n=1 Tax=Chloroflexus islandicus TaxID=1707952 RepID=A0A178MDM5_9CHLR|nr:hypothetical protein A6A03_11475 [Chloroflexus islandicus]
MTGGEQICHCEGAKRPKQSPASAGTTAEGDHPVLVGDCFAPLRYARNDRWRAAVRHDRWRAALSLRGREAPEAIPRFGGNER